MTKILNLDSFEQPADKTVVLNGKEHKFVPSTVEEFISQVKEIEAMEKAGTGSVSDFAEFSIKSITRAFPTIKDSELRALTVTQLKALSDFVKAVADDESEDDSGNGQGEG